MNTLLDHGLKSKKKKIFQLNSVRCIMQLKKKYLIFITNLFDFGFPNILGSIDKTSTNIRIKAHIQIGMTFHQ